ncbi:hypothetical protein BWZ29_03580 [Enterobacter cancerogenus]|uniref:EpsG family protein n=1 Tax=Enterobacter chuandaensis TaxID=2497875 RepID=UPI0009B1F70C|nr:EpsG family protein [Enterobacter chuandaensis]OQD50907.1 hypothetical protein BWZ29_03580 [Enterobacter cancerogenus]
MTIYFVIILTAGILGYIYDKIDKDARAVMNALFTLYFTLVIGLRDKVGVDWFAYVRMYNRFNADPWRYDTHELLYKLVNILGFQSHIGFGFVIFVTSAIFIMSIIKGAETAKINPYYFFALSGGYIFVMAGVNYIRQGVALAVMTIAFAHLLNGDKIKFCIFTLLAGLFHTSALFLIILIIANINLSLLIISTLLLIVIIPYLPLERYQQYFTSDMENGGLLLRICYLLVPATFLLLKILRRDILSPVIKRLSIICVGAPWALLIIGMASSTIADRLSYYFISLITMLVMTVSTQKQSNTNNTILIIMMFTSLTAMTIWIEKSKYIKHYIYNGYLFEWLT